MDRSLIRFRLLAPTFLDFPSAITIAHKTLSLRTRTYSRRGQSGSPDFRSCAIRFCLMSICVTESKEFQFRGELFNILNHTNLRLPVSDISSPNFRQIRQDVEPRVIQVALKFLF